MFTKEEEKNFSLIASGLIAQLVLVRKEKKMSQIDVAKKMDCSQQTVARIENAANPTLETLIKYAEAIGVELHINRNEQRFDALNLHFKIEGDRVYLDEPFAFACTVVQEQRPEGVVFISKDETYTPKDVEAAAARYSIPLALLISHIIRKSVDAYVEKKLK